VPFERFGQSFERSSVPVALLAVVLDFADRLLGQSGAFDDGALAETKFSHSLFDRLRDRRPVSRHPFLRAPPWRRA
jgi:hypothetical protein